MIREKYLLSEYWDTRATKNLNQNLSFSKRLNSYLIERKFNIVSFLIEIYKPKTVADIGCGVGSVLVPLAKKYKNIIFYAVDFSKNNLNQIPKMNNIYFYNNYVWQLPVNNKEIDFLFSLDVFYHLSLSQKRITLNEFNRISKNQYVNFRGEEISNVFYYNFLFKKLKIPNFIKDKLILFFCKKNELFLLNYIQINEVESSKNE